ncbi:axonemal dynein light intermediate polypeptide 1-like [Paralichthys olivaceus]|uniref:axonemal dynein light intermediate polypeptide 1-like n=1 Tax=Paralichthys olivaceus TaxID=8255 RepID=UPI0037515C9B
MSASGCLQKKAATESHERRFEELERRHDSLASQYIQQQAKLNELEAHSKHLHNWDQGDADAGTSYFFPDELIRQVTINCAERGLLLLRVRDEIKMTIAAYQTLYESSVKFSIRKALQTEQNKADTEKRISNQEKEIQDLKMQLNEEKAKCDEIEKKENEKRQVEEKKHTEEIQFLKKTIQQLRTQVEVIATPKKS